MDKTSIILIIVLWLIASVGAGFIAYDFGYGRGRHVAEMAQHDKQMNQMRCAEAFTERQCEVLLRMFERR